MSANSDDVLAAFDILVREIQKVIILEQSQCLEATRTGDRRRIKEGLQKVSQMLEYLETLESHRSGWSFSGEPAPLATMAVTPSSATAGARAKFTPPLEFLRPLLIYLSEQPGAVGAHRAINALRSRLELLDYDLAPRDSSSNIPRWRDTLSRTHKLAARLGYVEDLPFVWLITSKGREYLARSEQQVS